MGGNLETKNSPYLETQLGRQQGEVRECAGFCPRRRVWSGNWRCFACLDGGGASSAAGRGWWRWQLCHGHRDGIGNTGTGLARIWQALAIEVQMGDLRQH
jgi:hypothetical protein